MTMQIYCRAVPWGVPNSFNEILMAGCLKRNPPRAGLPMFISHTGPRVGHWDEFHDTADGLHVLGKVTDKRAIDRINKGELKEVSITYLNSLGTVRNLRILNAIEDLIHKGVEGFPGEDAIRKALKMEYVRNTILEEISLTDCGAFKGTEFRIVGESPEQMDRRLKLKYEEAF